MRRRRFGLGLVVLAAGLGLAAVSGSVPIEEAHGVIYYPSTTIATTPAAVGLPYDDVRFGDAGRLHGWFVPAARSEGRTLLWFHGNAGNIGDRVGWLLAFHRVLPVNLFIFDYSGYGASGGRPSERRLYADARDALAYLRGRPDVDAGRIVYFGKSLGGAVAVELTVEAPPHRLIVQSSFTSVADVARFHYRWAPIDWLLGTQYRTIDRIGAIRAPVLVVHGDADEIVPVEQGQRLYAAAPEPKELLIVPGARHNDLIAVGGAAYLAALDRFIRAGPADARSAPPAAGRGGR